MFDKNINPAFMRVARVLQYDYVAKPMKPLGAGEIIKERGRVKRTDFTEQLLERKLYPVRDNVSRLRKAILRREYVG